MNLEKRVINLANLKIGPNNPIWIQSMTNEKTLVKLKKQVKALYDAGCEIIRISVPDEAQFLNFTEILKQFKLPLVADIHYDYTLALKCLDLGAHGVRINPGNIGSLARVEKIIKKAKQKSACIRIGVNSGSLEKDILLKHGTPNEYALLESALKWIEFFENQNFYNFKVSIKSSNIDTFIKANTMLSDKTLAPIHLGLTEAGTFTSGLIKSTLALSPMLKNSIGNTIRISLSTEPVKEVIAGIELLKALKLRDGVDIISCPTCARTTFSVIETSEFLEKRYSKVQKNIKVAVMGCIVNGPGEAKEADIGIAGSSKDVVLFKKGIIIGKMDLKTAIKKIDKYINSEVV